jgi:hypothetical protein
MSSARGAGVGFGRSELIAEDIAGASALSDEFALAAL